MIEPSTVQKAFDDIAAMLKFYDGETDAEARRLQVVWMKHHGEHAVIAFVNTNEADFVVRSRTIRRASLRDLPYTDQAGLVVVRNRMIRGASPRDLDEIDVCLHQPR